MTQTRILVAHASRHGSTREVAEAVAATLRTRGFAVDVMPAAPRDLRDGPGERGARAPIIEA